mgnify:CR=1 FL=1
MNNKLNKIYNGIKSIYPYQIEPKNHKAFFKSTSGLWTVSRLPIKMVDEISFSNLKGWDWMSSKGAKLYSIIKNDQLIYLINTHLQSDYETDYSFIRSSQYEEINNRLILPNIRKEYPLILCGDLNISRLANLKKMLQRLNLSSKNRSCRIISMRSHTAKLSHSPCNSIIQLDYLHYSHLW